MPGTLGMASVATKMSRGIIIHPCWMNHPPPTLAEYHTWSRATNGKASCAEMERGMMRSYLTYRTFTRFLLLTIFSPCSLETDCDIATFSACSARPPRPWKRRHRGQHHPQERDADDTDDDDGDEVRPLVELHPRPPLGYLRGDLAEVHFGVQHHPTQPARLSTNTSGPPSIESDAQAFKTKGASSAFPSVATVSFCPRR